MSELTGRVGIVTGASAGIGLAIAEALVHAGARVILNARRADRLNALADRLNSGRPSPVAAPSAGDCADPAVIDAMLATARERFGRDADLVVINAGRGLKGSVADSDTTQWEEMVRTNLLGVARLLRAAGQRMVASLQSGAAAGTPWTTTPRDIIVIGSVVGRNVSPFSSMYGGTKFAVHGMTEGMRRELGPKGIRVTLLAPGFVVSEFQGVAGYDPDWFKTVLDKLGPALEPADVARMVRFIAAQPAHVHIGDVLMRPTRQEYP